MAYICSFEILRKSGKVNIGKITVISSSLNIALNSLEGDLSARFSYSQSDFSNCYYLLPKFICALYSGSPDSAQQNPLWNEEHGSGIWARPQVLPLHTKNSTAFPSYSSRNTNNWKQFRNTKNVPILFLRSPHNTAPSLPKSPYCLHPHSHSLFWHKNFTAFSLGRPHSLQLIQGIPRGYQN